VVISGNNLLQTEISLVFHLHVQDNTGDHLRAAPCIRAADKSCDFNIIWRLIKQFGYWFVFFTILLFIYAVKL